VPPYVAGCARSLRLLSVSATGTPTTRQRLREGTPGNVSRRSRRTSVAVVRSVFPKANLGLVLRFRCRWFLSPVLHKRHRFFVGSSRFCSGFSAASPGVHLCFVSHQRLAQRAGRTRPVAAVVSVFALSSDVTTHPVVCAASHQLFSLFNFSRGAVLLLFSVFLPVSAPLDFECCGFGLILGYRPNSVRNFNWLPFTPALVASSVLQLVSEPV
jgi:hypothetical protein